MNKKFMSIIIFALIAAFVFTITGCGEKTDSSSSTGTISTVSIESKASQTEAATTVQPSTDKIVATEKNIESSSSKPSKSSGSKTSGSSSSKKSNGSSETSSQSLAKSNTASQNNHSSTQNHNSSNSATKPVSNTPQVGKFTSSDTEFQYNGKSVSLGENINKVISKLGKAVSVSSAPSCHGAGEDKTYVYNGFEIYTYPNNGSDCVNEIIVTSPSISTSKGIKVGSTENDVIAAYGKNYSTAGYYNVYGTTKSIQFYIVDGVVDHIDYYYNI